MRSAFLLLPLAFFACTKDDVANNDAPDDVGTDTGSGALCDGVTPVTGTTVSTQLFAAGVNVPTDITHAGDGSGRVFVTTQEGEIKAYNAAGTEVTTFLDLTDRVGYQGGSERGLFSVAFHPDFATNNLLYVHYTDRSGDTVISEFTGQDASTERILITADQPAGNHNGGKVAFGPDGYLYIGLGDGGGAGDTYSNGQREDTFLAKLLRIDVDARDAGQYGIPSDNPFVGQGNHRPETWAWGLRNPWKYSFDRETGTMYIGDVGQDAWEEVDIGVAGGNYGWSNAEANHCFGGSCDLNAYEQPVYEYPHSQGISIVGGYVYRGCAMPDLHGVYFFSDTPWFGNSPLWSLTFDGGTASEGPVWIDQIVGRVTTLGEDEQGEIYIGEYTNGQIYKLVPGG
ncbi:MAG: glucose dehydrogenase [Deltaproteobacteria bacterium]|nr:MAG: glucose dehydrogenase [Deltaproteobacteria bacterium]